jgi:hypothetical protein
MLEIIYCEEELFDLPPPTLYYRGNDDGFQKLVIAIEKMINEQTEICLNDYGFIKVSETNKRIIFRPFSNNVVLKIAETEIVSDLSIKDWKVVIDNITGLINSKNSLTYFVEFEDYLEEGNMVIES